MWSKGYFKSGLKMVKIFMKKLQISAIGGQQMFHNICRKCRNIDRMGTDYRSLKNFESKKTRNSQWSKLEKIVHFRPIFRPFGGINIPR